MKYILTFLALAACATGGSNMTMVEFDSVQLGMSTDQVVATAGKPAKISTKEDGTTEYEYVEKITVGGRSVEERHYILTLKGGKVVSKRVKQSSPPGFDNTNSYEMQTTHNGASEES